MTRATPVPAPVATLVPASPSLPASPDLTGTLTSPTIRIGFSVDVGRVSIGGADAGMRVFVGAKQTTAQRLTFELANASSGAAIRFQVQVASLSDLSLAQQAAQRASAATGLKVEPVWSGAT